MLFAQNKWLAVVLLTLIMSGVCTAQNRKPPPPPPRNFKIDNKCYHNGHISAADRRRIFPFNRWYTIVIISFDSYHERAPIVHDSLIDSLVYERKELSDKQVDELTDILYNYSYSEKPGIVSEAELGCYRPRQAILFVDVEGKIAHWLEICFECWAIRSDLDKGNFGRFCGNKYDLLKQLCINAGITHFTDTGHDPTIIEEPKDLIITKPATDSITK